MAARSASFLGNERPSANPPPTAKVVTTNSLRLIPRVAVIGTSREFITVWLQVELRGGSATAPLVAFGRYCTRLASTSGVDGAIQLPDCRRSGSERMVAGKKPECGQFYG